MSSNVLDNLKQKIKEYRENENILDEQLDIIQYKLSKKYLTLYQISLSLTFQI